MIEGGLEHSDAAGHAWTLGPGAAQATSAGRGIVHAEVASPDAPTTRFVQTWVRPDVAGVVPRHARTGPGDALPDEEWVPVASGTRADAALRIGTRAATLWVLRHRAGQTGSYALPGHRAAQLFVARGGVNATDLTDLTVPNGDPDGGRAGTDWSGTDRLGVGDALRLDDAGGAEVGVPGETELLLWTFD